MATQIDMPKLSDTMTAGTVAAWLKNEGDEVSSGDVIAEIETDKATMELEAFEDGVLLKQIIAPGEQVDVGAPIAVIGEAGETFEISAPPKTSPPVEDKKEEAAPAEQPKPGLTTAEPTAAIASQTSGDGGRIKVSPLARKLADEKGIDLSTIQGSGPNGRIVKKDVLGASPGSAPMATQSTAAPVYAGPNIADERDLPVSQMRSVIAQRLVECKNTVPHFYLEAEVNAEALLALRKQLNAELGELAPEQGGIKFTVNDFILKASAEALRRVPEMNRSWNINSIRQHASVHMAFGVAIDDGLVTPVIRDAHLKGLKVIAQEAKELIGKARSKKLKPDEMTGSTFTVTNLGMFGTSRFFGIINPPNAGILSVGATIARPIIDDKGEVQVGQMMSIGLSGDHRAIDGAVGARYLQALKSILETPALILI